MKCTLTLSQRCHFLCFVLPFLDDIRARGTMRHRHFVTDISPYSSSSHGVHICWRFRHGVRLFCCGPWMLIANRCYELPALLADTRLTDVFSVWRRRETIFSRPGLSFCFSWAVCRSLRLSLTPFSSLVSLVVALYSSAPANLAIKAHLDTVTLFYWARHGKHSCVRHRLSFLFPASVRFDACRLLLADEWADTGRYSPNDKTGSPLRSAEL